MENWKSLVKIFLFHISGKIHIPIIIPHLHASSNGVFLELQSLCNPDSYTSWQVHFWKCYLFYVFIVDIQMNCYRGMLSQRSMCVYWTVSFYSWDGFILEKEQNNKCKIFFFKCFNIKSFCKYCTEINGHRMVRMSIKTLAFHKAEVSFMERQEYFLKSP